MRLRAMKRERGNNFYFLFLFIRLRGYFVDVVDIFFSRSKPDLNFLFIYLLLIKFAVVLDKVTANRKGDIL